MNKEVGILLDILQKKKLSVTNFCIKTGIPKDRVYAWKKGRGNPKVEDSEIIQKWIEKNTDMKKGEIVTNTENEHAEIGNQTFYVETIQDLRQTGINLSAGNKETAIANRILAENQKSLIDVLKTMHKPTADAVLSNQPVPISVLNQALVRIADGGIQKGWWSSQDQGLEELGKLLYVGEFQVI